MPALVVERVVPALVGRGRYAAEIAWTSMGGALRALATEDPSG